MNYTVQELKDLMVEAKTAAHNAGVEHLNKYGEHAYCGCLLYTSPSPRD